MTISVYWVRIIHTGWALFQVIHTSFEPHSTVRYVQLLSSFYTKELIRWLAQSHITMCVVVSWTQKVWHQSLTSLITVQVTPILQETFRGFVLLSVRISAGSHQRWSWSRSARPGHGVLLLFSSGERGFWNSPFSSLFSTKEPLSSWNGPTCLLVGVA